MQPDDIAKLVTLGSPALSPDGRWAVVAATRADLDENEYRSSLWIVATDGSSPPRVFTHGPHDSDPRYSPDGRRLAFLRRTPDGDTHGAGKAQLHLIDTAGGDPRAITELPLGAGTPHWSPDSSSIAFTARVPEAGRYGTDDKVTPDKEPPRRVTGLTYRYDNLGFLADRRSHVHVVDVAAVDRADGAPLPDFCTEVTSGDADDSDVRWTPDGRLVFLSARHDAREHDRIVDVFTVDADGANLRRLTDTTLSISGLETTADPSTVLVTAATYDRDAGWLARNEGLWRVDVGDAPVTPVRLTDAETVHLGQSWIVVDGDRALVAQENRGAVDLVSVAIDGSGVRPVTAGRRQVSAVDRAGGVLVACLSDPTTSGELARVDDGQLIGLTSFGDAVAPLLVPISELEGEAPDGYRVHGFLAVPPGEGPHPVLLMIHGGPFTQYGWTNLDEAQVYAAAGYAVVYGNPRGSSGYGEAQGRYIIGDVGPKQAPDLIALLDAALERPDLDGDRVGVLGGSHGGYMTTWLVGHSDRFSAAVSERAVNAIDSFEGSSDIGWDFADALYGTDPVQRHRQSPLTYADDIATPLLIVHSEQDWRCPVEQAQRLYVALRKRDAEVEMLLFPGEGHELSRSGLPSHRVARFHAVLEWFARYLTI